MKHCGFVYLLGNEWMPDVYKVGCTERSPHLRAAQLSEPTGVPARFDVLCYIEVENFQATEQEFHKLLDADRISENREFFHVEDFSRLVALFHWYPERLAFTDCSASIKLLEECGLQLTDCPDPWSPAQPAKPEKPVFDEFDGDLPWETPALKVVKGGKGA